MGRGKKTSASRASGVAKSTPSVAPAPSEERFSVEPYYRRSDRWSPKNPTGLIKDGYLISDNLTGAKSRVYTKKDAKAFIERVEANEATLDWKALESWYAHFGPSTPLMEVWGRYKDGQKIKLALVGRDRDHTVTRQNVLRWLEAMGRPELPERDASTP